MGFQENVTELLVAVRAGDRCALDRLFSIVYQDLRALAHSKLGAQRGGHTLNTTALVHETYLKLVDRAHVSPVDRQHFFATAARAMRQVIVDYARAGRAKKRGGGDARVPISQAEELLQVDEIRIEERAAEILAVDKALSRLTQLNPRMGQVVELRYFGGFAIEETSELLGISHRTVKRDWRTARAFLYSQLREPIDG